MRTSLHPARGETVARTFGISASGPSSDRRWLSVVGLDGWRRLLANVIFTAATIGSVCVGATASAQAACLPIAEGTYNAVVRANHTDVFTAKYQQQRYWAGYLDRGDIARITGSDGAFLRILAPTSDDEVNYEIRRSDVCAGPATLTLPDSLYPSRYTKPLGEIAGWLTAYGVDTTTVAQVDSVVSSHTDGAGYPEREVFYAVKFYERTGFVFQTRVQSGWDDAVAVQYIAASIKGVENFGRTGGPQREGRSPYVRTLLAMPDPGSIGFPIAIIGAVSPPEYELLALIPQDGTEFEQFHCAAGRVLHVAHSSRRFTGVGPILTTMAKAVCKHEVAHRASEAGVGVTSKP